MSDEPPISRRQLFRGKFFGGIARSVAQNAGERIDAAQSAFDKRAQPAPPALAALPMAAVLHRPPCAIDEISFTAQCTRCDACVRACPVDAIVHAEAMFGKAAGTPVISPRTKACVMCRDLPCVHACESEGTSVLHPQLRPRMGVARIIKQSCLAYQGEECDACVRACPVEGAMKMRATGPVVDEQVCTGCGSCQQVCPAPRNAVALIVTAHRPPMPGVEGSTHPPQA